MNLCKEPNVYDDEPFHTIPNYQSTDVYCMGSDEEETSEQIRQKHFRYQTNAERCARGILPVLQSTSLKGPFNTDWINPWRYRQKKCLKDDTWLQSCSEEILSTRKYGSNKAVCHGSDILDSAYSLESNKDHVGEEAMQTGMSQCNTALSGRVNHRLGKGLLNLRRDFENEISTGSNLPYILNSHQYDSSMVIRPKKKQSAISRDTKKRRKPPWLKNSSPTKYNLRSQNEITSPSPMSKPVLRGQRPRNKLPKNQLLRKNYLMLKQKSSHYAQQKKNYAQNTSLGTCASLSDLKETRPFPTDIDSDNISDLGSYIQDLDTTLVETEHQKSNLIESGLFSQCVPTPKPSIRYPNSIDPERMYDDSYCTDFVPSSRDLDRFIFKKKKRKMQEEVIKCVTSNVRDSYDLPTRKKQKCRAIEDNETISYVIDTAHEKKRWHNNVHNSESLMRVRTPSLSPNLLSKNLRYKSPGNLSHPYSRNKANLELDSSYGVLNSSFVNFASQSSSEIFPTESPLLDSNSHKVFEEPVQNKNQELLPPEKDLTSRLSSIAVSPMTQDLSSRLSSIAVSPMTHDLSCSKEEIWPYAHQENLSSLESPKSSPSSSCTPKNKSKFSVFNSPKIYLEKSPDDKTPTLKLHQDPYKGGPSSTINVALYSPKTPRESGASGSEAQNIIIHQTLTRPRRLLSSTLKQRKDLVPGFSESTQSLPCQNSPNNANSDSEFNGNIPSSCCLSNSIFSPQEKTLNFVLDIGGRPHSNHCDLEVSKVELKIPETENPPELESPVMERKETSSEPLSFSGQKKLFCGIQGQEISVASNHRFEGENNKQKPFNISPSNIKNIPMRVPNISQGCKMNDEYEKVQDTPSKSGAKTPRFLDQSPWVNEINSLSQTCLGKKIDKNYSKPDMESKMPITSDEPAKNINSEHEFLEEIPRNFSVTPENSSKLPSNAGDFVTPEPSQTDTQRLYKSAFRNPWRSSSKKLATLELNKQVSFEISHSKECSETDDSIALNSKIHDQPSELTETPNKDCSNIYLDQSPITSTDSMGPRLESSPRLCAMAEAFIAADHEALNIKEVNSIPESEKSNLLQQKTKFSDHEILHNQSNEKTDWMGSPHFVPVQDIDFNSLPEFDVEAMLGNIGDFLEDWSVEAELKKIK